MNKKQKIFVGISGGVDSSVSAYLLKKEGYDVHGVFVKTWSPEWLPCTWQDEKRDAMRICAALDIPFHFLDAEEVYKESVAEYMIAEYKAGRTPNPDVLCNREIKFGVMWEYAKSLGADALATGHYAQIREKNEKKKSPNSLSAIAESEFGLYRGKDTAKDQVYFLWMIRKEELAHIRFPIGHLEKKEVRTIAEKAGLFTSTKKDSQGICFLGDVDMKEFLSHYIQEKPGDVVNEHGIIVGKHTGVTFYTLGERHGFTVTEKTNERKPYFVIAKDIEKNLLIVSHEPKAISGEKGEQLITLRNINFFEAFDTAKKYTAEVRYHGAKIPLEFRSQSQVVLSYSGPIPLGQSLVVYDNDAVVAGGIIEYVD